MRKFQLCRLPSDGRRPKSRSVWYVSVVSIKANSFVYASTRDAAMSQCTSQSETITQVGIPSGSPVLPRVAILRYNSASRLWKTTESSPFSSIRYSMNRTHILGSIVSRKSATLDRGSSTSSDWNIYGTIKVRVGLVLWRSRRAMRTSKAMFWSCWKTHLEYLKTWSMYSSPNFWRYKTVGWSFSCTSVTFWLRLDEG